MMQAWETKNQKAVCKFTARKALQCNWQAQQATDARQGHETNI
jgi:hypothetical protein